MIRNFIFQALYRLQISSALQWMNRRKGRFPILVFHRVSPHPDPFWIPLSVIAFERILILLKKHYTVLPIEDIFNCNDSQLRKACFITFDDGFEDTYTWARPLLLKHGIPASFFIPTESMASGKVIWPLQLRNSIHHTSVKKLVVTLGHSKVSFTLTSEKEKIEVFNILIKHLSGLKEKDFLNTLSFIFEYLGRFNDEHIQIMNMNQLNELASDFGIHSHTHNHYYLSSLSRERVAEEFLDSIRNLNNWLTPGKIKLLAYPIGDYSEQVAGEAEHHFEASFRVGDELAQVGRLNERSYRMKIPRFNIHHESAYEVYALINGMHTCFKRLKNQIISKR